MQAGVGLLITDVMPIYVIIAMNNIITMRFSNNCPIVICLPTICYVSREKPLVKTMARRVYFDHITKTKNTLVQFIYFLLLFNLDIYHYQI